MLTLFINPYDTSFREEESSWQVPTSNVQADLIDVSRLSRYNRGFKFLLTCIDVFSKQAWVVPLKDKTGTTLVNAFESIRSPLPQTLQTDKGSEFTNRKFQQWLKEHQVHFFTTENEDIKASIVERFNRTLKSKLWRYFTRHDILSYVEVLESMVEVYNRTPHRSIGMAPLDVTTQNKAKVWFRLYADPVPYKEPLLRVGDSVRISKARRTFKKGYLAKWTEEIFTIVKRKSTHPLPFYWLITQVKYWKGPSILKSYKRYQKGTTSIISSKFWSEKKIEFW